METLTHWRARRSGGRITITGRDRTGHEVKVPNVDTIASRRVGLGVQTAIVAKDKDGDEYELVA